VVTDSLQSQLVDRLWNAVSTHEHAPVRIEGPVTLDSAFAVSEFAAASTAVAGLAASRLIGGEVVVDRPLASRWFEPTVVSVPVEGEVWDAIAGDYETADYGWIRLHTNAPRHREAALRVLGTEPEKDAVAAAVATWRARDLESAIVEAGGCAAEMRSFSEWMRHPQGVALKSEPLIGRVIGSAGGGRGIRGAKVLDLTRIIAGPAATRLLAGLGADVLRIDPPEWSEPLLETQMTLGKRAARLDARADPGGLADLIRQSDVVVHGYRPGALEGLGFGDLDAMRPGIVEVAIDAYGWTGPWAGRRGFDSLVQMSSGIAEEGMRWFGRDRPTPLPVQALDFATGMLAAAAALEGIAVRRETGHGSRARLSLARTSLELAGIGRGEEPTAAPLFGATLMHTPWGAGELVESPVTIDGSPLSWASPPRPLGSDEPRW
jgi:hypothetical protein